MLFFFFFSSRRRHTRYIGDWSSDVCSSDLPGVRGAGRAGAGSTMATLVNILIAGLATGAIYALVAIGFTLLWQTSQTINFAQGEFVMLPAFFMLAAMNVGLPFWAAILIGFAITM